MMAELRFELRCPQEKRVPLASCALVFGIMSIVVCTWAGIKSAAAGTTPTIRIAGPLVLGFVGLACVEFFGCLLAIAWINRIEIDDHEMAVIGLFTTTRIALQDVERVQFVRRYSRILGVVPILK